MSGAAARDDALRAFAARALGARVRALEPLAGGLGPRRFVRVRFDDTPGAVRSVIARIDAPEDPALRPPGVPPEPPLEPIRRLLESAGLPVPRCHAADPDAGVLLLEDLGDTTLEHVAHAAPDAVRRALYAEAAALPARLQALRPPADGSVAAFGRHLDESLFAYKGEQVIAWLVPWLHGRAARDAEARVVRRAFAAIAAAAQDAPQRLAHRDFKAQNLHVVEDARGAPRLVMIDLQGALLAPPEYDLVCLLRDLHVALPEAEVQALLAVARPQLPDAPAPDALAQRFTLLTISRVGKDLSRFLYAIERRGDTRYRRFLPRGAAILNAALERGAATDPALAALAELLAPALARRSRGDGRTARETACAR